MRRWAWISGAVAIALCAPACKRQDTGLSSAKVDTNLTEAPPTVSFGITAAGRQSSDHWKYLASYTRFGKTARFGIDLRLTSGKGGGEVRSGVGSFMAESGSRADLLLQDLKQVLKATSMPRNTIQVRALPFRFDVLGEKMERGRTGLVDATTGNWVSTRIYLGVSQDKELILNFQAPGGTAEILSSDPQFGNDVLNELAKVL